MHFPFFFFFSSTTSWSELLPAGAKWCGARRWRAANALRDQAVARHGAVVQHRHAHVNELASHASDVAARAGRKHGAPAVCLGSECPHKNTVGY